MKQHPILFNTAMVQAILSGAKTQTRRLIKPIKNFERYDIVKAGMPYAFYPYQVWMHGQDTDRVGCMQSFPFGKPGDGLWVRESGWQPPSPTARQLRDGAGTWPNYVYAADGATENDSEEFKRWGWKSRPSIHMPRWASRITLEITDVRAERLQDISEEDADAEGADTPAVARIVGAGWSKRHCFGKLWNSISGDKGPSSWHSNPWVWVCSFKRVQL